MSDQRDDILKGLQDDARRLRLARKLPPTGELTDDQVRLVAEDFNRFLDAAGVTLDTVSRSLGKGYSAGVLSSFRSMGDDGRTKYTGNAGKVARAVNGYMERHAQQREAYRPDGFVETAVAKKMLTVIQQAIKLKSMALIASDTGRGKSMVFKAAQEIFTGSVLIRVRRKRRTDHGLLRALHDEMKLRVKGDGYTREQKIIDTLKGTDRPLLIDEAHQLTPQALEFIRDLNDECEIPIVLGGTRDLMENTQDQDRFFGQFASRIALRYDVNESARGGKGGFDGPIQKPIHTVNEIVELFHTDKLKLTSDGLDFLFKLANLEGEGGLRLVKQVLTIAVAGGGGRQITRKLLMQVLREMHGGRRTDNKLTREIDQMQIKVA